MPELPPDPLQAGRLRAGGCQAGYDEARLSTWQLPPSRNQQARAPPAAAERNRDAARPASLNAGDARATPLSGDRAPLSRRFDRTSRGDMRGRCRRPASDAHRADPLAHGHIRSSRRWLPTPQRTRIRDELKWLNAPSWRRAGSRRRDRTAQGDRQAAAAGRSIDLERERADGHRRLARALRSVRYRRLIKSMSAWIESGPWSTRTGKQAAKERACPIAAYGAHKLCDGGKSS